MAPMSIGNSNPHDYTLSLPDECLSFIFQSLLYYDRKHCSLVCRRWLRIEGQNRRRLSLNAQSNPVHSIPSIPSIDSITELALTCHRFHVRAPVASMIGDEALIAISLNCKSLTRLTLHCCREITVHGLEALSKNSTHLKVLSIRTCTFGARGLNAVLNNSAALEELYVKRLYINEPIGPGAASSSLKVISLKKLENAQFFGPLIRDSKSLRTLKLVLIECIGTLDILLQCISDRRNEMKEVHLVGFNFTDVGLSAVSKWCPNLEILCLVRHGEYCTDAGIVRVAERCRMLRKIHLHVDDFWKGELNRIGDQGLIAVAENCRNLEELVLNGVDVSGSSLEILGEDCVKLGRLSLGESETVGDAELMLIAANFHGLEKLWIECCPVSNHGVQALAYGCPYLVEVKFSDCRAVTLEGVLNLRACRPSLAVKLDMVRKNTTTGPAYPLLYR